MSGIAYKGNVRIDLYQGDKIYKSIRKQNEGTSELFRYIANCLIGNFNQDLMPQYIHTFYCNPDSINTYKRDESKRSELWSTSASSCVYNVHFSSVQVRRGESGTTIESEYISEFTFLIPYSQIDKKSGDKFANVICLYNTDRFEGVTPLAYITLEEGEELSISSNTTNIAITWELSILNQTKGE